MNEMQRLSQQAKRYKELYPAGTRLCLINMDDPHAPVPAGTRGTVDLVDDIGQIHMTWDNGRTLALVPEVDSFRKLTAKELEEEGRDAAGVDVVPAQKGIKAVNIEWDVDFEEDLANLPSEIDIPSGMTDEEEISDYLTNVTGYCHKGFALVDSNMVSGVDKTRFTDRTNAILSFDEVAGEKVVCVDICYDNDASLPCCEVECLYQAPATNANIEAARSLVAALGTTYNIPVADESRASLEEKIQAAQKREEQVGSQPKERTEATLCDR